MTGPAFFYGHLFIINHVEMAQGFGYLSFLIGAVAFSQTDDNRMKKIMLILFLCQSIHFFLLGALAASAANVLNLLRTALSIKFTHYLIGVVFILLNMIWGITLYQSYISVLPIIGGCLGTYAVFYLSKIKMRVCIVVGASFWLTHNILVESSGGVLLEIMVISVNIMTILRIYYRQQIQ